ncbi:MAG: FAD-dependent oxidoreductase [Lachnospiraceae bacterium]
MESVWRKQIPNITAQKETMSGGTSGLPGILHFDVIVIGTGMSGLLTAYYLQKEGLKVMVLEAKTIASGQTEKTTAKVTSQHDLKYHKLIKTVGVKKAWMYARANEEAIREYERLIREEEIPCDWKRVPAYLYSTRNDEPLKKEAEAALRLGIKARFTRETELPFSVEGALCFPNQAQFSPLAFLKHIAGQLMVLENTKVLDINGHKVKTEKGIFSAEHIVAATHYPLLNLPGFYFLRQHQERSYVLALSGCKHFEGMYYGIEKNGLSFRQAGEYLLLGGGGHRTGENQQGGAYDLLLGDARRYFPHCREAARWSAQDCMPHDGIPFIGKYSVFTPQLYVITGFQKWGMTSSMVAAILLRDMICGTDNPYEPLFTPQRMNFRGGFPNLVHDVGISVKGLWKGAFHCPKETGASLPKGHGGIVTVNRKRYACYRDEQGMLHCISARCPHMGCELSWNPDEKTWDCPCHGSRFDADGNLLDNPAKKDDEKN